MGTEGRAEGFAAASGSRKINGDFQASPGWDASTGLGSPDGGQIATLLGSASTS